MLVRFLVVSFMSTVINVAFGTVVLCLGVQQN